MSVNVYFQSEKVCFLTVVGVDFSVSFELLVFMHPTNVLLIFLYTAVMG
jgi:hypothetical protein